MNFQEHNLMIIKNLSYLEIATDKAKEVQGGEDNAFAYANAWAYGNYVAIAYTTTYTLAVSSWTTISGSNP
jgi:hypothetical protein